MNDDELTGVKFDGGKARMDLVPWDGLDEIAHVLTFGADKYADRNYRGLHWSRIFAACMRHLTAWWLRRGSDPETGRSHLAHAGACVLMLLDNELGDYGEDDRP